MRRSDDDLSTAEFDVVMERLRQRDAVNWSHEHDDAHVRGELAEAGAAYAVNASRSLQDPWNREMAAKSATSPFFLWPWEPSSWKPRSAREDLVRAAALLIAEIERLDRATKR